mgnify:CR=1 FL=1
MKDNVKTTPIDWEQRKYDLAVALYYHDIRLSDIVTPKNRLARWTEHISVSAEMAAELAEVFINEYRRQAVMESGEKSHAP